MLVSGWAMLCVLLPIYFIRSAVGEKIVRLSEVRSMVVEAVIKEPNLPSVYMMFQSSGVQCCKRLQSSNLVGQPLYLLDLLPTCIFDRSYISSIADKVDICFSTLLSNFYPSLPVLHSFRVSDPFSVCPMLSELRLCRSEIFFRLCWMWGKGLRDHV